MSFAFVEMVIPWGLLAHGEVRLNNSTAGLLVAATPIITVMLGKLLGGTDSLGHPRWTACRSSAGPLRNAPC